MARIEIDTTDPQYQQLLNGLETLKTVLAPRIKLLLRLRKQERMGLVRQWLQRDPLMRETLRLARQLSKLMGEGGE